MWMQKYIKRKYSWEEMVEYNHTPNENTIMIYVRNKTNTFRSICTY